MAKDEWRKSVRREMMWDNIGMIASSVSFIAALGCIFGAAFMLTVVFFTQQYAAQRPSEQVVVPAQIETNKEKDEYEPVDETKERGGLRFVPAVYTRYENDDEF